jgi:hypothetical protein
MEEGLTVAISSNYNIFSAAYYISLGTYDINPVAYYLFFKTYDICWILNGNQSNLSDFITEFP